MVSLNPFPRFLYFSLSTCRALGRIPNGCRSPAKEKACGSSLLHGQLESISQVLVLLLVNLQAALHQVKRSNRGMGDSARENTSKGTEGKVLLRAELTAVLITGSSSKLSQGLLAYALAIRRGSHWLGEECTQFGHVHLLLTSLVEVNQ